MTSLSDILAAREARFTAKTRLARESGRAVVCVTLRACAEARERPEFIAFFNAACARVTSYFERAGACLAPAEADNTRALPVSADGPYKFYLADDARRAKTLAMRVEETQPYGALLDIDVMDASCTPLTRDGGGGAPRACLVCGRENARECIISRAHTRAETLSATLNALKRALE